MSGRAALFAVFVASTVPTANAMEMALSSQQMCEVADAVVFAEVTSTESRWAAGSDGRIETVTWLSVDTVLAGQAPSTLSLVTDGGSLDGLTMHSSESPHLERDRRYMLYLSKADDGTWNAVAQQGVVALRTPGKPGGLSRTAARELLGVCNVQ